MQLATKTTEFYLAPFPSYGQLLVILTSDRGLPYFNALARGDPLRISG